MTAYGLIFIVFYVAFFGICCMSRDVERHVRSLVVARRAHKEENS